MALRAFCTQNQVLCGKFWIDGASRGKYCHYSVFAMNFVPSTVSYRRDAFRSLQADCHKGRQPVCAAECFIL